MTGIVQISCRVDKWFIFVYHNVADVLFAGNSNARKLCNMVSEQLEFAQPCTIMRLGAATGL
jgi:hypothetical protein